MTLTDSRHVRLLETGSVVALTLPDGNKIALSPQQAAHAKVEPHGNHGRSRVTVTLTVEAEVQGAPEAVRNMISNHLAAEVERLRGELAEAKRRANTAIAAVATKESE